MKKFKCITCGKIFETEDKIIMRPKSIGGGVFKCTMEECDVKQQGALGFNVKRVDINVSDT